jgi:shikimate dehydrogenase
MDWAFLAFDVPDGEAETAVAGARALGIEGLSVTMPHKAAVIPALDRLTTTADRLGAVNTISRRGPELVGDSTDGPGFIDALRHDEGFDPSGRRCLVLGAGGAARAVVLALADAGAAEIVVVNRTAERGEAAAALAGERGRTGKTEEAGTCDLIVNATPVGMAGSSAPEDAPIAAADLGAGQVVVDLVYHPPITPLLLQARAAGAVAVNGLGMLIHQAAHAFRLWTGQDPPLEAMSAAALNLMAKSDVPMT